MRKFMILALLIPALSYAQQKKDSKIIVKVSDTTSLYNNIIRQLYQRGYIVEQKDEQNGFIATKEKTLPNDATTSVIIKAIVDSGNITLTGEVADNVTMSIGGAKLQRRFTPIYYGGMKGSSLRNSWNELNAIASQFGREITYAR